MGIPQHIAYFEESATPELSTSFKLIAGLLVYCICILLVLRQAICVRSTFDVRPLVSDM